MRDCLMCLFHMCAPLISNRRDSRKGVCVFQLFCFNGLLLLFLVFGCVCVRVRVCVCFVRRTEFERRCDVSEADYLYNSGRVM